MVGLDVVLERTGHDSSQSALFTLGNSPKSIGQNRAHTQQNAVAIALAVFGVSCGSLLLIRHRILLKKVKETGRIEVIHSLCEHDTKRTKKTQLKIKICLLIHRLIKRILALSLYPFLTCDIE